MCLTEAAEAMIVDDMIRSPKQWLFKNPEGLILKDIIGQLNKRKEMIGLGHHLTQNGH